MDPFVIMITSVVCAVGMFGMPVALFSLWAKHKQKMAELSRPQLARDDASSHDIAQLSQEIARLRDTTTQYDLSVEHTLTEIKQRLATLEAAARIAPVSTESRPATIRKPSVAAASEQTAMLSRE